MTAPGAPAAGAAARAAAVPRIAAVSLLVLLAASACDGGSDDPAPSATSAAPIGTAASPATPAPTEPAAPDAVLPGNYDVEDEFPQLGFERMIEIDVIPGEPEHATMLTQGGIIYRFNLGDPGEQPTVFLDISDRLLPNRGNEEGLLGLAFDPGYQSTGRLYVYYSAGPPRRNTLSRFRGDGLTADPASETKLIAIDDPFSNHNGGALAFGPDGMLYVGVGDGGSGGDPQGNGQNTDVLLGKILRIDVSGDAYTTPPGNPFAAAGGAREIFAWGFRNPWRISFDTATGTLWTGDVGQDTWEEVGPVAAGENHGWNRMEGFDCFEPRDGCDRAGLTEPRAAYGRDGGCSVSGGYVYRGRALPELTGYYVYADYCSGNVWAVNTADDSEPVLIAETGLSVPGLWEDPTGELHLIAFNGKVVRLVRRAP